MGVVNPSGFPTSARIMLTIGGGILVVLVTYILSSIDDRYRASEALRDQTQIRLEIELVERRMHDRLIEHRTAGPHDKVSERLAVLETTFKEIKQDLSEIKTELRELGSSDP